MIKIDNISKIYSENTGNFNISANIEDGQVFGIIGPNGAGKTTLIRQIMGFIKSDEGTIDVDGLNPWKDSRNLMENTGYVAGEMAFFENLTGIQYLKMISSFRENVEWDYVEKLIDHFELEPKTKIKKMSKGMKQKVALIASVCHKPKFIVFDEPTTGLDPLMQQQFQTLVNKLKKEKTTIILCSHIFEEVAKLCDKVAFIKEGRLLNEFDITDRNIDEIEKKFIDLYRKESKL